jgi:ankyrin repeat protein
MWEQTLSDLNSRARGFRAIAAIGLLSLGTAVFAADFAPTRTLVDLAREHKRDSILAAITSPDVDVNVRSADGATALMWATYHGDQELVAALLKAGAKANVANKYGATALTEAIRIGDLNLFRTLLDAGSDIEAPNGDKQTALMLAISGNQPEMAKLLIERGANVKAIETFRDQTVLMFAAGNNMPEILDMALARGAATQVNLRGKHDDWARQITSEPRAQFGSRHTGGLTALLYATRSGCHACAVSLINAGADVNLPNPDGLTPLINAIDNRRFDTAMLLLDKGANPHTWDWYGRTPLYTAVTMNVGGGGGGFGGPGGPGGARGAPGGAGARGPGGGGGPGPGAPAGFGGPGGPGGPGAAAARGPVITSMQVITRLLDMGVDPNHELTQKRPYGTGGGRFEQYDRRGGTGPLMIAVMNHDHEAMQVLLARGAEPDVRNAFQMSPLMIAAGMSGTGRAGGAGGPAGDPARALRTIELLLDAGANIDLQVVDSQTHTAKLISYVQGRNDQEGKTSLMHAAETGNERVAKLLLDRGANPALRDAAGKSALDIARTVPPVVDGETEAQKAARQRLESGRKALAPLIEAALAQSGAAAR